MFANSQIDGLRLICVGRRQLGGSGDLVLGTGFITPLVLLVAHVRLAKGS